MNLLRRAAETLQTNMERDASETVLYHRAGQEAFPVPAIIGRTLVDNTDRNGFLVRTETRDFTIRVSLLRGLTPQRNDKIKMLVGGKERIYIVNGDGASGAHYDETDGYNIAYRIHTKLDKIVDA